LPVKGTYARRCAGIGGVSNAAVKIILRASPPFARCPRNQKRQKRKKPKNQNLQNCKIAILEIRDFKICKSELFSFTCSDVRSARSLRSSPSLRATISDASGATPGIHSRPPNEGLVPVADEVRQ
jgi:hypothetical protein